MPATPVKKLERGTRRRRGVSSLRKKSQFKERLEQLSDKSQAMKPEHAHSRLRRIAIVQ